MMAPECSEALVALVREMAACRTFPEVCADMEAPLASDEELEPFLWDDLIERARDLLDTYGLHPMDAAERRELTELGYLE